MNKKNLFTIIAFLYCMALAIGSALVASEHQETQFTQERRANYERYLLPHLCEANTAKPAYIEPKIVELVHNHDMLLKFPYEGVPESESWKYKRPVGVRDLAWGYIPSGWRYIPVKHKATTLNLDGTHTTILQVYPQCNDRFSSSTWSAQCDNGLYTAHNVLQASVLDTWKKPWSKHAGVKKRQKKAHCEVYGLQEGAATAESLMQAEQDGATKEKYSQLLQLAKTGIKACIAWYQNPGREKREWNQERRACNEASHAFFCDKKWTGGSYYTEMRERNHE